MFALVNAQSAKHSTRRSSRYVSRSSLAFSPSISEEALSAKSEGCQYASASEKSDLSQASIRSAPGGLMYSTKPVNLGQVPVDIESSKSQAAPSFKIDERSYKSGKVEVSALLDDPAALTTVAEDASAAVGGSRATLASR